MTAEWQKYHGTPEQKNAIFNAEDGVKFYYKAKYESTIIIDDISLQSQIDSHDITHYLICKKLPHAKMRAQHAMTGQAVLCRHKDYPEPPWEEHYPQWDEEHDYKFKEPEKEFIKYKIFAVSNHDKSGAGITLCTHQDGHHYSESDRARMGDFVKWIHTEWQEVEI